MKKDKVSIKNITDLFDIDNNIVYNAIVDKMEDLWMAYKTSNKNENTVHFIPSTYENNKNHIINLWEEIQIDIIKQSFINPKNWIEFSFDKLPNNDLKVIITKLIGNLSKWCNASDFWWDIEDANKFDNTNRLKTWKEKRDINIFISDKIRNLKSMINRQLETTKDIKFIQSIDKVWSLVLR